jgi:predicted histone-like DNA-binding protein
MSIKFQILPRKNPQDLNTPAKYYAAVKTDGVVELDELAELISDQCTVTEADCYAVLVSLEKNISRELSKGRIVRMGKMGSFQISISSNGMNAVNEVSSESITNTRILFRPGQKFKQMLTKLKFKKAA